MSRRERPTCPEPGLQWGQARGLRTSTCSARTSTGHRTAVGAGDRALSSAVLPNTALLFRACMVEAILAAQAMGRGLLRGDSPS